MALSRFARLPQRLYSSAASGQAQITQLPNGVTVVTQDQGQKVGTVSIYGAAGSRNETAQTAGFAHFLKALPFSSTQTRTNVYIAKEAESLGVQFDSCVNRENVGFHATFLKPHFGAAVSSLVDIVTAPAFFDWEVRDNAENIALDLEAASGNCELALLNDAHRGLFRNTLGRPYLCPAQQASNVTASALKAYYQSHFVGQRVAVVGTGVNHADLVAAVSALGSLPATGATTKASKYFGGAEIRTDLPTNKVLLGFAFPGAALGASDSAAVNVLKFVLGGNGASIKYGSGSSRVAQAVGAATKGNFTLQAVHSQYSDAGLLAVTVATDASVASGAATAAASAITSVLDSVSDAEVAKAKNQLTFALLSQDVIPTVSGLASNALASKKLVTPESLAEAVAKVSVADVKAAAAKVKASKPVYVARGNLDEVPYLDQLFK